MKQVPKSSETRGYRNYTDIKQRSQRNGLHDKSGLRDGKLYYYRVCATNAAGDSAFSNEASGTTPLQDPTSLQQRCHQVKSTLLGLISRFLRPATRLNER